MLANIPYRPVCGGDVVGSQVADNLRTFILREPVVLINRVGRREGQMAITPPITPLSTRILRARHSRIS
jgi:hypothetical protein